ncbi:MAG: proteasome assembly chaperone family protein [Candidatus Heimdallarchaeota archaeon]
MTITLQISGNKNFKDNTLITGFHGIGTTGFIAAKYITNELNAVKIGTILSDFLPPFVTTKDGKLSLPFELFREKDNIILVPHFQPYRHEHKAFADKIVEWTINSKFQQTILIGGLDARLKKNEDDKIRAVATSAYLEKNKISLPILEDGLFVTGPIAIILALYEVYDYPAIALLPYAESSRADPLAASIAIKAINKLANIDVNVNKLIQDAELIEHNIQDMITQTKEQDVDEKERGTKSLYI